MPWIAQSSLLSFSCQNENTTSVRFDNPYVKSALNESSRLVTVGKAPAETPTIVVSELPLAYV